MTEIKSLSYQQIFDHVVAHAMKQGKRCKDMSSGTCMYRLDKTAECTTMCFVGCLIPNHLYVPEMESNDAYALFQDFPIIREYICGNIHKYNTITCDVCDFLNDLQIIHDRVPAMLWMVKLIDFAKKHELELPVEMDLEIHRYHQ